MSEFSVRSIATVRTSRRDLVDDNWGDVTATIELAEEVPTESLRGLEQFSHVELLFVADRATDVPPEPWLRHPRGSLQWPEVGIFAQRSKDRPNRLLASIAELVEVGERSLTVKGLDAVDGTPVVDVKPWFNWSGPRGIVRVASWSDELGRDYF